MRRLGRNEFRHSVASFLAMAGFVLAALLVAPASDAQEKRIALIIGNGTYAEINSLDNSTNDARLMRSTLQGLGFEVIYSENVDKRSMEKAIGNFATKLYESGRDTVSLVYYAGHGVQSNGENFLLPVDVPLRRETDLRLNAIRAGDILAQMEGAQARVKIVILDACRDNPFELTFRTATRSGGLADMRLGNTEFFIAYAATAGNVAWDGDGDAKNSPYAVALAKNLPMIDTEISEVFRIIRNDVANTTRGRQLPEARTTLRDQFYFNLKNPLVATINPTPVAPMPAVTYTDAGGSPAYTRGAPIQVSSVYGNWCEANRSTGGAADMKFEADRWDTALSKSSATFSIAPERPEIIEMKAKVPGGRTFIAEFGEFTPDSQGMTYLRGRYTDQTKWNDYNRRLRKC